MREIGSEFWIESNSDSTHLNVTANQCFLLSGRTTLDFVSRDSRIKSIMLPSYCCHTMIEPFLRNYIDVSFYSVGVDCEVTIPTKDYDAILLIDYFGYAIQSMTELAKHYYESGKVVIYDSTHRLNGNSDIEKFVDYSICSYRKWMYCNCAVARKHKGEFNIPVPTKHNLNYTKLRNQAASEKKKFIDIGCGDKALFLAHYAEAEELLERDYVGYAGLPILFDRDYIIRKRRENAECLVSGLSSSEEVQFFRNNVNESDTPLCVPILLKDEQTRNQLTRYLISKDIYCPIHWPLSGLHLISEADKDIYRRELSLICDQRYDFDDMQREITEIRNFFERTTL